MQACEYGLVCATDDEALLVKNLNAFLAAQGWRPLYRKQSCSASLSEPFKRAHHTHFAFPDFLWQAICS